MVQEHRLHFWLRHSITIRHLNLDMINISSIIISQIPRLSIQRLALWLKETFLKIVMSLL
jgi:hypothetical protein